MFFSTLGEGAQQYNSAFGQQRPWVQSATFTFVNRKRGVKQCVLFYILLGDILNVIIAFTLKYNAWIFMKLNNYLNTLTFKMFDFLLLEDVSLSYAHLIK